ncbi:hypothetical protein S7335_2831 [Synechococcus sp. PCC 7335]|uniref:DUF5132 domain-containing protein n=1 Tax=Synechococcus sp. (strain ATCC 29403 / PCC 7335) TaxID=91464 RepID=UPI00017EBC8A|nr:DUF5132 domain-containing protein [Synechococcus sp. PCC 7335]EDX85132.1 hypothetical protein S7335_2831 [Synechococcus sp. PCC 7335]
MRHLREGAGLRARVEEMTGLRAEHVVMMGAATVVLTPVVLPLMRPVLKATIKTGVMAFERTKHAIAETGEILADIAAEAKAEAQLESLLAPEQLGTNSVSAAVVDSEEAS